MGENKFLNKIGSLIGKKDSLKEIEEQKAKKKMEDFFRQKITEFHELPGSGIDVGKNVYKKPYAKGFTDVDFKEALYQLHNTGDKEKALEVLNTMKEKAIRLDPSWPDIKEMEEIINYIKKAEREDLL